GFSLVRKIISEYGHNWSDCPDLLEGKSLGEVLLAPTQIYVKPVLAALKSGLKIHGMAHITGGGLPENLPRCLGEGQAIQINPTSWQIPPIFDWLAQAGQVQPVDMFNTFNMGIGFVVLVPPEQASYTMEWFVAQGIDAFAIATIIPGSGNLIGLPE
ncbi:MAG: AIR synthase-related protein, partial [Leptolyngbyaceae bacterium]|nr:AIR synthase-related protein [Leptolyngbyaceae bacterium]